MSKYHTQYHLIRDFNKESPLYSICRDLKVKDLIDTVFSHNNLINLWERDFTEPHYSNLIWKGHVHEMPEQYQNYKFLEIKGMCAESTYVSDYLNVECISEENYKKYVKDQY